MARFFVETNGNNKEVDSRSQRVLWGSQGRGSKGFLSYSERSDWINNGCHYFNPCGLSFSCGDGRYFGSLVTLGFLGGGDGP